MINFNKMWKTNNACKKIKREIKEIEFKDIDYSKYIIIDIRGKREYKEGHLSGSINIPLFELKRNISKYVLNKEELILVYCQSGIRSKKAACTLEGLGYINVYNLKGGLDNI